MNHFEPSNDFVNKVMRDVRIYEATLRNDRVGPLLSSRSAGPILYAAGILLAAINLIRMASILFPSVCY